MAYIFVGGSQRTGTSIMQQTLCQLPGANPYVYEASYLRLLVNVYAEASHGFVTNHSSYFGDRNGLKMFNAGVVNAFLQNTALKLGNCQHLILKEPHLTMLWPELYELVPDAYFMMMVRDPRDAIASMVQVGQRQKDLGQNYFFANRNIPQLCDHFLSFYTPSFSVEEEGFRKRLAIIHYEELATDPAQLMKEVAEFTGLPFDRIRTDEQPDHGHVESEHTTTDQNFSAWVTEVSGQKLSRSRVGNFASVLTAEEVAVVEDRCADFFDWFGYSKRMAS